MYIFEPYIESIEEVHRSRVAEILHWVHEHYPQLQPVFN